MPDNTVIGGERVDGPPSPSSSGSPLWGDRLLAAKAEPGQWFRYGPYASSSIIRSVNVNAENLGIAENIEATTRKREDDGFDVYVVYREA